MFIMSQNNIWVAMLLVLVFNIFVFVIFFCADVVMCDPVHDAKAMPSKLVNV